MLGDYTGHSTPWPGNWNEGETKIPDGSSQLFLFDQREKLTQLERLAGLFVTSIMERLQEEISKNLAESIDAGILRTLLTATG
jgi:hypothetical protein